VTGDWRKTVVDRANASSMAFISGKPRRSASAMADCNQESIVMASALG
jgi:hypothetical protein